MEIVIKKMSENQSSSSCMLPKNIFTALNLFTEVPYKIHFGSSTETSLVGYLDNEDEAVYFPENIFSQLNLLQDSTINIWSTDKDIFIGPVVGLLVGCVFMEHARAGKETTCYYVNQHVEASFAQNCFSYFFCIDDVDFDGKRIKGFTFIPELNKYDDRWFPIPEVVYAKNLSLTYRVRELLENFKKNYNVKLINNCFMLGKWELCEVLCKYPKAKKYVPETIVYRDIDDAISMLNKHEFIFLKAFYGQKGKEVLSVEKLDDKYKLNYFDEDAKEKILDNLDALKAFIINYVGKTKFIVQQGLRLVKYKNHTIDLRLLMMKDEFGKWESVYKIVRVARENFNITTVRGRRATVYEKIYSYLQQRYAPVEIPSVEKLDEAAAILAEYTEMDFGAMGEMGMDIGIDISGDIWIIEANSDPLKNLSSYVYDIDGERLTDLFLKYYKGISSDKKILPQISGIFKYAKFLAGASKR